MALYSRIKTFVDGTALTASDLNNEFNNILNNAEATDLVGYSANVAQMQVTADPGGVGSESLAASTADELARLRFKMKEVIGGPQWYSTPTRSLTGKIATGDINDSAITTALIADGAVTRPKLSALGQQLSSSSGTFTISTNPAADVTNLNVTITTTGRPVYLALQSDNDPANPCYLGYSSSSASSSPYYRVLRGTTQVVSVSLQPFVTDATLSSFALTFPPGFLGLDVIGAGTYTYKVQVGAAGTAGNWFFQRVKLVAFEL